MVGAVSGAWITCACQLSAAIVIVYDHVLVIDQEVELVWKKRWTLIKVLYILVRYFGGAIIILNAVVLLFSTATGSSQLCNILFSTQGPSGFVLVISVQLILQFRLYAMYSKSLKIAALTSACFVAELIAMSIIFGRAQTNTGDTDDTATSSPSVHICATTKIPKFFYSYWIPIILFEAFLCCLAIWAGIRFDLGSRNRGRIVKILLRDSITYFLATFAAYITNAIIWLKYPNTLFETPIGFAASLTIIMSSRLILNLRGAYWLPFDQELKTVYIDYIHPREV